MDSNAFLLSFGMKPGDFDCAEGPIESADGFVYRAWAASSALRAWAVEASGA